MSESNENLPANVDDKDDGPPSALAALPPHLLRFLELHENERLPYEKCIETLFPGKYANPRDTGWRWYWRPDVQAGLLEMRAEAVKRAGRGAADVLTGMWNVADRCLQKVTPKLDRKGEQVMTETVDGEALAYEFDSNGAMRALESLANYHGMTKTRTEITGKDGGPIQTQSRAPLESQITPEQADRDYLEIIKRTKTG